MNQQFNVEYLGFPNKQHRYYRVPTLHTTGSQFFNNSQEIQPSRIRKNIVKPKLETLSLKKDDNKNFYHHTTIYNVKEFKELGKLQSNEQSYVKYNEMQTKMIVADFKRKIDAYIQQKLPSKITSSLKELESFQSANIEEQLNKSLCTNKYTIRTEYKTMKAMEILVVGQNNIVAKQIISSERIQMRLLKQMEQFLKDDRVNYDIKMQTMIEQYQDIVTKIRNQSYTVKIPKNYVIQMSDYNEYYQTAPKQISHENLDLITDQIIQEIQQSKKTTPRIVSQNTSNDQIDIIIEPTTPKIEDIVKTEPVNNNFQYDNEFEEQQLQDVQQKKKSITRKQKTKKQNKQDTRLQQQVIIEPQQIQQTIIQEEPIESNRNQESRRKKQHQQRQVNQVQENDEEELKDQFPIEELGKENQEEKLIQKKVEFNKTFKPKTHSRRVTEDVVLDRLEPIQTAQPKEDLIETLSEQPVEDLESIEQVIQTKKQELFQYRKEENIIQEESKIENEDNINKQPIAINIHVPHEISEQQQQEVTDFWEPSKSPKSQIRQRQIEIQAPKQQQQQQQQNEKVISMKNLDTNNNNNQNQDINEKKVNTTQNVQNTNINNQLNQQETIDFSQVEKEQKQLTTIETQEQIETKNIQSEYTIGQLSDGNIDYERIIKEKMKKLEAKLKETNQDIFDILLAAKSVYDIDIENHKLGNAKENEIKYPQFIFDSDVDNSVFKSQSLWRKELQYCIPRLSRIDKYLMIQLDQNGEYLEQQSMQSLEQVSERHLETDDYN